MNDQLEQPVSLERIWRRGVERLADGDIEAAAVAFAEAAEFAPAEADVWLGLHAAGRRRDDAVAAMLKHRDTFGRLRARLSTRLSSEYMIGDHVSRPLEDDRDLQLAAIASMLHEGQYDAAGTSLQRLIFESDEVHFLRARHAMLSSEWDKLSGYAVLVHNGHLREEVLLYEAMADLQKQEPGNAFQRLMLCPRELPRGGTAESAFALWRGLALEAMGHANGAAEQYLLAHRLDPQNAQAARKVDPDAQREADTVAKRAEHLALALAELDALVGLESVKHQVRKLQARVRMDLLRAGPDGKARVEPMHLLFVGPPGTGKTTVARIIGKLFFGLGILERGHVVETSRAELVGRYQGHTAATTTAKLDEALDGVLFIDEAYSLNNGTHAEFDGFGVEAVNTLVKRSEDDRDRLTIILAGYPEEMKDFLTRNTGLRSRFITRITFPSYSVPEMVRIADSFFADQGSRLSAAASGELWDLLSRVVAAKEVDRLGNGRLVRQLCAEAAATRDLRLAERYPHSSPPMEALPLIEREDVSSAFRFLTASEVDL